MSDAPWTLSCPWCDYRLMVFPRGARGRDLGSGVEAALAMQEHAALAHDRTWNALLPSKLASRDEPR